jgi:hypothetical protein
MPPLIPLLSARRIPLAGLSISIVLLLALESPWSANFNLFAPPRDEATFARFVGIWIWCAAALHFILLLILTVTWKWWTADVLPPRNPEETRPPGRPSSQHLLAGLSIIIAACTGFPRLSHSLWGDELITFRESVAGHFSHDVESDGLKEAMDRIYWSDASWADALWQYETTNPHFLYNLAGKLALTWTHQSRKEDPWVVRESALRWFPFLAGLGALPAWFLLACRAGARSSAGWFCLALSLHPWFIRYTTEARGYAFVFLFLPLALMALDQATRDSRWRNWTLYGVAGGILIYSWPGMVIPWISLTAAMLVFRWRRQGEAAAFPARRLVLTNLVLAMVLLTLVAPCFAQLGPYLREDAARLPLDASWLGDVVARMLLGIDWIDHGAHSRLAPRYITFESLWRSPALALPLVVVGVAVLGGFPAGLRFFLRKGNAFSGMVVGMAASALFLYLPAAHLGVYLFPWYFIFLLPGFVLVVVAGLLALARPAKGAPGIVLLALGAFGILSARVSAAMRAESADPRRESVLAMRGTLDPLDPRNPGILTAHLGTTALGYDPLGWYLEETPEPGNPTLPTLMRMADILGRELFVNVGYPLNARAEAPTPMGIIDKSGYFTRTHQFPGLEPQFEREIYRYEGGMFGSLKSIPVE